MSDKPELLVVKQMVDDLVKAIGLPCEVVLHDFEDLSSSIIAIAGDVTGRPVGGPMTDLGLRMIRAGQTENNLVGYPITTADGRPLRSSSLFIRDQSGKVLGSLCINIDLTYWSVAHQLIASLCDTRQASHVDGELAETFEPGVTELLKASVERAIGKFGKPVSLMKKADNIEIVRMLDEEGVFLIRGSAEYVADALGVSRPTIYNYLSELRAGTRFNSTP